MRIGKNYIFLLFFLLLYKITFPQKIVFKEDFETTFLPKPPNLSKGAKVRDINSYLPKEKWPLSVYSDRNDKPYGDYYFDSCCPDTSGERHGFYSGITLFEKKVPSSRHYLIIELDTVLNISDRYNIGLDIKYHPFVNYRIDSLEALFVKQTKDIDLWLSGKAFKGMFIHFYVGNVDNKEWKNVSSQFVSDNEYKYVVIGNLKDDEETTIIRKNNCVCSRKPKGFWEYSYLFIDNILVSKD